MGDFSGRKVIVTGGTRGIGAAITEAFLAQGADVTALYGGNDKAAEAFKEKNKSAEGDLETVKLNVSDYENAEKFFGEFIEKHEKLDVLVNSAGIRKDAVVGMMKKEEWDEVINVNLTGTFIMSKLAVMAMMRKKYGRIINITSPSGKIGIEGQANYAASKAGQVAFTKSLAKETASRKITVNCVSPGFIETDLISDIPEEMREAYKKSVPLKRFGQPEEVAPAVLFLSSENASYITGTVLEVTGGL